MRKICLGLSILGLMLAVGVHSVEAKSYLSKRYPDKYQRLADRKTKAVMRRMEQKGENAEITLSDYEGLEVSRWEEKEMRKSQKNRTYKSPKQQFKEMDSNRDGKVSREEMMGYYTREAYEQEPSKSDKNADVYKYGEPLPTLTPEQEAEYEDALAAAEEEKAEKMKIMEDLALTEEARKEKIEALKKKYQAKELDDAAGKEAEEKALAEDEADKDSIVVRAGKTVESNVIDEEIAQDKAFEQAEKVREGEEKAAEKAE